MPPEVLLFIALLETYLSSKSHNIKSSGVNVEVEHGNSPSTMSLNGCLWMAKNTHNIQEGEQGESCEQSALSIRSFSVPLSKKRPEMLPKRA